MELGTKILQYFFHLYPVVNAHEIKRPLLAAYLEILIMVEFFSILTNRLSI